MIHEKFLVHSSEAVETPYLWPSKSEPIYYAFYSVM